MIHHNIIIQHYPFSSILAYILTLISNNSFQSTFVKRRLSCPWGFGECPWKWIELYIAQLPIQFPFTNVRFSFISHDNIPYFKIMDRKGSEKESNFHVKVFVVTFNINMMCQRYQNEIIRYKASKQFFWLLMFLTYFLSDW